MELLPQVTESALLLPSIYPFLVDLFRLQVYNLDITESKLVATDPLAAPAADRRGPSLIAIDRYPRTP